MYWKSYKQDVRKRNGKWICCGTIQL